MGKCCWLNNNIFLFIFRIFFLSAKLAQKNNLLDWGGLRPPSRRLRRLPRTYGPHPRRRRDIPIYYTVAFYLSLYLFLFLHFKMASLRERERLY